MKKILVISCVLLCVTLFTAAAFAMENEPEEFRGIPWGAEPPKNSATGENVWGLMEIQRIDSDARTVYCRLHDEMSIGGVKISSASVEYNFLDSLGFARVFIKFKGRANIDRIRKVCMKDWGEPESERILRIKDQDEWVTVMWEGWDIIAMLNYKSSTSDKLSEAGNLSIYTRNYYETIIKEHEKHQQKAGDS